MNQIKYKLGICTQMNLGFTHFYKYILNSKLKIKYIRFMLFESLKKETKH